MKQVAVLMILFGLVGFAWFKYDNQPNKETVLSATSEKTVEERLSSLENRVWVLEKNAGLVRSAGVNKANEQFINLTSGSVLASEWTKITGTDFNLDTALYGKSVEVSWQGWVEGTGSVRLYDATNHRVVDYSEFVSNNDSKKSFYTKPLAIWRGQNQYYLEGKSGGGEVVVSSPRLRIVTK